VDRDCSGAWLLTLIHRLPPQVGQTDSVPDSVRFRPLHSTSLRGGQRTAPLACRSRSIPFRSLKPAETGRRTVTLTSVRTLARIELRRTVGTATALNRLRSVRRMARRNSFAYGARSFVAVRLWLRFASFLRHKSCYVFVPPLHRHPLAQDPRCQVPAVSSDSTARFTKHNSVLCPKKAASLSHSLLLGPRARPRQRPRQSRRHPSFHPPNFAADSK